MSCTGPELPLECVFKHFYFFVLSLASVPFQEEEGVEEEDEEEVVGVDGEEAPAEDHPPDHGARGAGGQVPPDLLGVPLEAGLEVEVPLQEVVLSSPNQQCSSQTNLDKPSTPRFQSQVVQLAATQGWVGRSTVTGRPGTEQTGEPHSLAGRVCTTRRRREGCQRRRSGWVWRPAL